MKKLLILTATILLVLSLQGKTDANNVVLKAKVIGLQTIPYGPYKDVIKRPGIGGELDIEFLSSRKYPYQHHWYHPTIGVGIIGADLGAPDVLGQMIAMYPYLKWDLLSLSQFNLGLKTGVGIAALTKKNDILDGYISGFVNLGLEARINFSRVSTLTIEIGTHHLNNANMWLPNHTLNNIYGAVGYHHRLGNGTYRRNGKVRIAPLDYMTMVNLYVSGGGVEYYLKNGFNALPIGTIHADFLGKVTNCYATGVGLDLFYNGTFMKQQYGIASDKLSTALYDIPDDKLSNKLRLGLSWGNAFTMGRMTALLDLGIYLYDPIKNCYHDKPKDRGMIYSYDPDEEHGWLWMRAGLRFRVVDNLFLQAAVKTHIGRIEGLEFGIGYSIPMKTKASRNDIGNSGRARSIMVIHPDNPSSNGNRNLNSRNRKASSYRKQSGYRR